MAIGDLEIVHASIDHDNSIGRLIECNGIFNDYGYGPVTIIEGKHELREVEIMGEKCFIHPSVVGKLQDLFTFFPDKDTTI